MVLGYNVALVAHFLGLIALFGSFIVNHRAVPHLRSAITAGEARPWIELIARTMPMQYGGLGLLLASGLAMALVRWPHPLPWMVSGLLGLVFMSALSTGVTGRWIQRVEEAVASACEEALPPSVLVLIDAAAPKTATASANGMALALLWVMAAKPGWIGSLSMLGLGAAVGGALGLVLSRRDRLPERVRP